MIPKKNNLPPPSNDNKYLDGRGLRTLLTYIQNWVHDNVPELTESEDERIVRYVEEIKENI